MIEEAQRDWSTLYAEHLSAWQDRLTAGLEIAGFEQLIVFAGEERMRFRDDQTYPYAVEPYFKAWLPLLGNPGSALRLAPGKKPVLVDVREADFWHASPAEPSGYWTEHFEILQVASATDVVAELGSHDSRSTVIGEPGRQTESFSSINDSMLLDYLDYYRAFKTPYEVECISRANEIAALGHVAAQSAFREGVSEFELHQAYCSASSQSDGDLPYPNIVCLNEHASILHYQHRQRSAPEKTRSFLIDAGAQCNGYAADVTRTYALDEPEFQALIDSMEIMQSSLCDGARAGVEFPALHDEAHRLLSKVLKEHALIHCSAEQAHADGITRVFLPHGLGHFLGLQVHDVGGRLADANGEQRPPPGEYPTLRTTRILEPGCVVTIEPGLYFIGMLLDQLAESPLGHLVNWDKIAALLPCGGIRIEDDVLVTDGVARNLSRPAILNAAAA